MDVKIKIFEIPRSLDENPKVFGYKISTVIVSLGLMLTGLILLAKSVLMTLVFIIISYINIRLEKKFTKSGGFIAFLLSISSRQKAIWVDCTIEYLIKKNKNKYGGK